MKNIFALVLLSLTPLMNYAQCGSCNQAVAAKTWVGDVDDDWNDPLNWSGDILPTTESVTIDGGSYSTAPVISVNSVFNPADVFIVDGATLTIQANLTLTDDFIIRNNSFLVIEGGSNATGDDINLCNGGTINMSGGILDNTAGGGEMRVCTTEPVGATGNTEIIISGGSIVSNDNVVPGGTTIDDYVTTSGGGTYTDVDGVLPVDLLSFVAHTSGNQVKLQWVTASELNNSHFEIKKSTNGLDFENIGRAEGFGTTNELHKYEFVHTQLEPLAYYQLKQYDYDGKTEIFDSIEAKQELSNNHFIEISRSGSEEYKISAGSPANQCLVYNLAGHIILSVSDANSITFNTQDLPKGIYVVKMIWSEQSKSQKFLLQ